MLLVQYDTVGAIGCGLKLFHIIKPGHLHPTLHLSASLLDILSHFLKIIILEISNLFVYCFVFIRNKV